MIVRSFDPDAYENPELDFYFSSLLADIRAWMGWYRETKVVL